MSPSIEKFVTELNDGPKRIWPGGGTQTEGGEDTGGGDDTGGDDGNGTGGDDTGDGGGDTGGGDSGGGTGDTGGGDTGGGDTCLVGDTLVVGYFDGDKESRILRLDQLRRGDWIQHPDGFVQIRSTDFFDAHVWNVVLLNGISFACTPSHRIPVDAQGTWRHLSDLEPGARVHVIGKHDVLSSPIAAIDRVGRNSRVVRLEVEETDTWPHCFVASNAIHHNKGIPPPAPLASSMGAMMGQLSPDQLRQLAAMMHKMMGVQSESSAGPVIPGGGMMGVR